MKVIVVKYNTNGTKIWEKDYVNNTYDCIKTLSAASIISDGTNLYVSGGFFGTVNFGNNNILTGDDNLFMLKLDGNGNTIWAKSIAAGRNFSHLLLDNANQDLFLGGLFSGTVNFGTVTLTATTADQPFLAKYSSSAGTNNWAVITNNNSWGGYGIVFKHPDGNIGTDNEDTTSQLTLKEYDPSDGSLVTATSATSTYNYEFMFGMHKRMNIAPAPNGFLFSGHLQGSFDFGGITITSTQPVGSMYHDMIVVKYSMSPASPSVISGTGSESGPVQPGLLTYPNPATGQITVQNRGGQSLGNISIYDVSGRMVEQTFTGTASRTTMEIQKLSPGVYYLRSDQSSATVKFVKQ
jgi:hypothetical protein